MIETGNLSDFNLVRQCDLHLCKDQAIATTVLEHRDSFPLIYKLLSETTQFYTDAFPELRLFIKREKRLVVFETPSRVQLTHEYTLERMSELKQGFHFLFNATERLSWLKVFLEDKRISIASKEVVVSLLEQKLGRELVELSNLLMEDKRTILYRLYNASDGKPCFVEFNQKEYKGQQSLLLSITYFDSIRNRKGKKGQRCLSPLKEKLITYNYETLTADASAWVYFKAPTNFVLRVNHNVDARFVEPSESNDDEITSMVFTPKGSFLSAKMGIWIEVPKALSWWYNIMLYVSLIVALIYLGFVVASFVISIPKDIVGTLSNISFAMVAAMIATRGWLMSEEQVMKKISNLYAVLVGILIFLTFGLTTTTSCIKHGSGFMKIQVDSTRILMQSIQTKIGIKLDSILRNTESISDSMNDSLIVKDSCKSVKPAIKGEHSRDTLKKIPIPVSQQR